MHYMYYVLMYTCDTYLCNSYVFSSPHLYTH